MDEAWLEGAVAAYGQVLLRYCHHILCDYGEAQEAVQDTFLKAWDHRANFREGSNLSAWLYRLAYTTCLDQLRRRKRVLPFAPKPITGVDYIGPELRAALETLSGEERALVFGRVMEERSYDELAEIFHKSAPALRKRYERAKGKLAAALEGGKTDA